MNDYELKYFKSTSIRELITTFNNGKTIRSGCVEVFQDTIGKPGDRIIQLKSIVQENKDLSFTFGNNEKIIINEPKHIVINDKDIGIQYSKKIKWLTNEVSLEYTSKNDLIETRVLSGEHNFRIKQNSSAFLFYIW